MIQKIKAEIERLMRDTKVHERFGYNTACNDLLSFIESLEQERVPENEETGTQEPSPKIR